MLYDGSVETLKRRYAPYRVLVVQLAPDEPALAEERPVAVAGAEFIRREDVQVWLHFDPQQVALPRLIADITARYAVSDLSIEEPDLEPVIRQMYETREVAV